MPCLRLLVSLMRPLGIEQGTEQAAALHLETIQSRADLGAIQKSGTHPYKSSILYCGSMYDCIVTCCTNVR